MPGQRKALFKELVAEVRVERGDSIMPTFRLPCEPACIVESVADRSGLKPHVSTDLSR
jgi:hypothetical protein